MFTLNTTKGIYHADSSVVITDLSRDHAVHGKLVSGDYLGKTEIDLNEIRNWNLKQREGVLAKIHERDHYMRFISTPVGLLLWRCFHILSFNIKALFTLMPNLPFDLRNQNILDWYKDRGLSMAKIIHPKKSDYLEMTVKETECIYKFIQILYGEIKVTTEEYCEYANEAYRVIALRSGIYLDKSTLLERPHLLADQKFKISNLEMITNDPNQAIIDGNDAFSIPELLEGIARLREYDVMLDRIGENEIKNWEEKFIYGVYEPFYERMKQQFSPQLRRLSVLLFDSAMFSPIDISCHPYGRITKVFVEDVHPTIRMKRLLKVLDLPDVQKQLQNVSSLDAFQQILFDSAKIPRTKDYIIGNLETQDFLGADANWGGELSEQANYFDKLGISKSITTDISYTHGMVSDFKRALKMRKNAGINFIYDMTLLPNLEFYKGGLTLNNYKEGENYISRYYSNYRSLITNMGRYALLKSSKEIRVPEELYDAFFSRISRMGLGLDLTNVRKIMEPHYILRNDLGDSIYDQLKFI